MPAPAARADADALLTPGQVADLFHVTPKTVSRWHRAGILPALRTIGGHRRFPAGPVYELHDFLEAFNEDLRREEERLEAELEADRLARRRAGADPGGDDGSAPRDGGEPA